MRFWFNGHLLPPDAPATVVALTDQGFQVGHGVFQTLVVHGQTPFALTRHLSHLSEGARTVGLPTPPIDQIREGVEELLSAAGPLQPLGRLRITWSAGPAAPGPAAARGTGTLALQVGEMTPYGPTATACAVPWTRNERGALRGVKSLSYGENRVAVAHAHAAGADEAVFANTRGHLCEGATSNVFYVLDGELCTPTLASGALPGVTRELLLEWTGAREVDDDLGVLDRAEEIFLTSTTRNVQPVVRWNDRELSVGPTAAHLAELWSARMHQDLDP